MHYWLVLACFISLAWSDSTLCFSDSDCNHGATPFCTGQICIANECFPKPSPCMGACSESLRQCVECNTPNDCLTPNYVCDPLTHKCRYCREDADCSEGTYCQGGHYFCLSGRCTPPTEAMWPCSSLDACNEQGRYCYECRSNEDCGVWNYCTNDRSCNFNTGRCESDGHVQTCSDQGKVCNSQRQACVECNTDLDCKLQNDLFCQPKTQCDPQTSTCFWNGQSPCPNANDLGQPITCQEQRKMCVVTICPSDASCSDGNACNGVEHCVNGICIPSKEPGCPEDLVCGPDGRSCIDPHIGQSCQTDVDCRPYGLICRIISTEHANTKSCLVCRTHAQCSDGDPSNGEELCDPDTHRCVSGIHPCENVPSGFVYNPMTGKCDLNSQSVQSDSIATPPVKPKGLGNHRITTASTSSSSSSNTWIFIFVTVFVVALAIALSLIIFGKSCCVSTEEKQTNEEAPVESMARSQTGIHKTYKFDKHW